MSDLPSAQRSSFNGSNVVRVKMKPALEETQIEKLMKAGIGVLDFDAGASVESDAASGEGAGRSFSSYIDFTRDGGYGVLTNESHTLTVVGFVEGPCAMFLDLEYDGKTITEKAFQFDRYVVIENTESKEPELYSVLRNYDALQTMSNVTDEGNRRVIYETFHTAEERGNIRLA